MVTFKKALNLAKFLIGWPLGIVAVLFIVKFLVNDSQVLLKLKNINLLILAVSFFCFIIYYFLRVYIWKRMLKLKGHDLTLKKISYVWELSEIVRFVPGAILPFVSRAKLFEDLNVSKRTTLKLMFTEIELLVTACTIISILSLSIIQSWVSVAQNYITGILISLAIALTLGLTFGYRVFSGKLKTLLPDFGARENFILLLLYAVTFFLFSAGVYLTTSSVLGLKFESFLSLVGFFTFAFLIGYISPITPGGIGLREAIITFGLSSIYSVPIAGLIAIFSRIVLVATEVFFLLFTAIWRKT